MSRKMATYACTRCGVEFERNRWCVDYKIRNGWKPVCTLRCATSHLKKTDEERAIRLAAARKRHYEKHKERLLALNKSYKNNPEMSARRKEYDLRRRTDELRARDVLNHAKREYGEFWEAYRLTVDLVKEIRCRTSPTNNARKNG